MKEGKLLIADDNRGVLQALQILLSREFEQISVLSGPNQLLNQLEQEDFDVVLLDMNFKAGVNTGNEGIFWLREIKKKFPDKEVVMITAYGDVDLAVKALKDGATDFVLKPWDNEKLVATCRAAFRLRKSNRELSEYKSREVLLKNEANGLRPVLIGKSRAMQEVLGLVAKVAPTDANVLITGENGTGKELIAREIHRLSGRSKELFVLVDLAAVSESLFESELFGHKKGSFTHAFENKTGRVVLAHRGTLFLDEIGNIPMNLQSKLLTLLQTRIVTPVGANTGIPVDIRLISATNKNLPDMIAKNEFRQDLVYRLNTIQIHLPPLRERPEDIADLVQYYLEIYAVKYRKPELTISRQTLDRLSGNPWYGNIRELQHTVEKAVILADTKQLSPRDFLIGKADERVETMPDTLEEMEKKMILRALENHKRNQKAAAAQLGITRQTLYNKMKKYDL